MRALDFAASLTGRVTIDFCFACQVIWFDAHESTELSPGGVLEVFKALDANRIETRNTLPALLDCPRCQARLELTQDLQHSTRFSYYRCTFGHGRLTPFLQFLREKEFRPPDLRPGAGHAQSQGADDSMLELRRSGGPPAGHRLSLLSLADLHPRP